MKLEIRDFEALSKLSLVDVRAYLTSQGWQPHGRYGDVATIFHKTLPNGCFGEVLLPMREELGDYAARMGDLVASVAELEQRSQLTVFNDLVKSGFDVVRFRAPEADEAGTIALEHGVLLYDQARDLIAAASNAAVKPKRMYRGSTFDKTKDYLQTLRLGQTEVGSYVLNVLSPVPPSLESAQTDLFGNVVEDQPFARAVTLTLDRALRATKRAVVEATASGRLEPFEKAVDDGVSGNLCQAVAILAQQAGGVDISVTWSRVRSSPVPTTRHVFSEDNARVLSEAATSLRERDPENDTTVEGFVTGLRRELQDFDGTAKIRGFVANQIRTITAEFQYADYQKVIHAHDEKLPIRVDGDIIRKGVFLVLERPRNLVVLDEEPFKLD